MEIIDLCKTVIHLESTHSRTVIKTAYDKDIINLLSRGSEVFTLLSQCNQHLAKVSDIVPLIEVSAVLYCGIHEYTCCRVHVHTPTIWIHTHTHTHTHTRLCGVPLIAADQ